MSAELAMVTDAPPIDAPPDDAMLAKLDYGSITAKHPEYIKYVHLWDDFRLLYKGGNDFLLAAGMPALISRSSMSAGAAGGTAAAQFIPGSATRIPRRFLWQLEGEPNPSYLSRLERAFYVGYVGPIVDYFVGWLFSQPPRIAVIKDGKTVDSPDWWAPFERNCTGSGMRFLDFLRDAFRELLICRRVGWMIGAPDDTSEMSQDEAESAGADGVQLTQFNATEILDWEKDNEGNLNFVVVRKIEVKRVFPWKRLQVETIRYLDRNLVASWEVRLLQDGKEKDVRYLGSKAHNKGKVPFVMMEIPDGLWVLNKLASWQIDLFNQMAILSRGELLSCFLQPYLKSNEEGASARVFGEASLLRLRLGDGDRPSEEYGWTNANVDPLKFLAERLKDKRDEGYRIVHQMSLAVDADNTGAATRSAASKIEERHATEIILTGFGGYMREASTRTANAISIFLGDNSEWVTTGFDNFQVSSLEEEIQTAILAQSMNFKSKTAREKIEVKLAQRILDHEDETTLETIKQETEDAYEQEEEEKLNPIPVARPAVPAVPGAKPSPFGKSPASPMPPPTVPVPQATAATVKG